MSDNHITPSDLELNIVFLWDMSMQRFRLYFLPSLEETALSPNIDVGVIRMTWLRSNFRSLLSIYVTVTAVNDANGEQGGRGEEPQLGGADGGTNIDEDQRQEEDKGNEKKEEEMEGTLKEELIEQEEEEEEEEEAEWPESFWLEKYQCQNLQQSASNECEDESSRDNEKGT